MRSLLFIGAVVALLGVGEVRAQEAAPDEILRGMTPEQREELWHSMSPHQRREFWWRLTPEQREAIRARVLSERQLDQPAGAAAPCAPMLPASPWHHPMLDSPALPGADAVPRRWSMEDRRRLRDQIQQWNRGEHGSWPRRRHEWPPSQPLPLPPSPPPPPDPDSQ